MPRIELDAAAVSVRVASGELPLLHPTSLELTESRIGVIGPNGSGKSTLARMLNGLVVPTSGRVLVDGLDTDDEGAAVRRRVGFVFTDPNAQLVMPTAAEDLGLSLRRTLDGKAARRARALEILAEYGLADKADTGVHELSGGQKQMLALAGVLAVEPEILVADEPTTLLDLRNARLVADRLFGLTQQLVLVTHDLELAARCDRVLVVDEARVVYDGPAAEGVAHYRDRATR